MRFGDYHISCEIQEGRLAVLVICTAHRREACRQTLRGLVKQASVSVAAFRDAPKPHPV